MYFFFQCVAEVVAENGLRGLAELVPGGGAMYTIAEAVWKKYRERRKEVDQRSEIQQLAQVSFEEAKQAAVEAAKHAAAGQPELVPALELYLSQIPGAIRQSLKRSEDPTGKTVPQNFVLRSAEDVAKLLPAALPRFRPGDPLPGKAGWVLDRQLGLGGFGEVWLARHPKFQSLVGAVKFCRNLPTRDRDMLHESKVIDRLLAQGPHANIVRLIDVYLEGEAPWLMYEYVEAGDLADLIYQWSALPAKERVQKAAAALHELAQTIGHFHGFEPAIVHRDLKPANILKDGKGRLRITDFGISGIAARQMIESETRGQTTRAGRLQSYLYGSYTPLYASPQQRDGADPDPRDDVHALGVIAYQMLTGHLSQGVGPDFAEDLKDAGVDDGMIELLRRCTAQKVERRPKNASAIAEALGKWLTPITQPILVTPLQLPERRGDAYDDIRRDIQAFGQALKLDRVKPFLTENAGLRCARWREAAVQGFPTAQFLYGLCCDWGIGATLDIAAAISWYRKAADRGEMWAQYNLGTTYRDGRGVTRDDTQAIAWFRKAADQGLGSAQTYLGLMYEQGRGVYRDEREAANWYRKAAEQGEVWGQHNLGIMYKDGRGVAQDDLQAVALFRKAVEQGMASAHTHLGWMYERGRGVRQDDLQAVGYYRKAADMGEVRGIHNLGTMYKDGRGVPQDEAQAAALFRKAAELGLASAQTHLALLYQAGRGVAQSDTHAVTWFLKAAEQGYASAQTHLGLICEQGRGVQRDDKQGAAWYRKAAEQGDVWGQHNLGIMYKEGRGVPQDDALALAWFRKAADQGLASAQTHVGLMYHMGRGVPQDNREAVVWYRKAADQGEAWGQYDLGLMYENGRGVTRDVQQAIFWYRKAADQGHADAKASLQRLGK